MEVQLDPVGGIAGDMFIAALLNAFPEQQDGMFEAIDALRLPGLRGCRLEPCQNHGLQGLRFLVDVAGGTTECASHRHRLGCGFFASTHFPETSAGARGVFHPMPNAHNQSYRP